MHLTESAGKCGLAALVGAGHDDDALRRVKHEVVDYGSAIFRTRQREIEAVKIIEMLGRFAQDRITEGQIRLSKRRDQIQP